MTQPERATLKGGSRVEVRGQRIEVSKFYGGGADMVAVNRPWFWLLVSWSIVAPLDLLVRVLGS